MHYVYIIYSPRFSKYYVGETANFEQRFLQHNQGVFKNSSTKFTNDWEKKLLFVLEDRKEARVVEKYICPHGLCPHKPKQQYKVCFNR